MVDAPYNGTDDCEDAVIRASSILHGDGQLTTHLQIPSMHCGGCMGKIERALTGLSGVSQARANLSTRRVSVTWDPDLVSVSDLTHALEKNGFNASIAEVVSVADGANNNETRRLLMAVGVAGFATANIMLLSVAVWSGADHTTRQLFHLVSGVIAVPAVAYAGQPFFRSAMNALRHGRLNMDVPISLAVLLAVGMSLFECFNGGEHAYFDASVMLLFFLLIGRCLDHIMRDKARDAVSRLSKLAAKGAVVHADDGRTKYVAIEDVTVGMTVTVAAGERFPVDGVVTVGESEVDRAIATGESASVPVRSGDAVEAGTLNLLGPLSVKCTKPAQESFLAQVIQMMETAEQGKAQYVRVADRVARIYAPAVHALALATFIGWMWFTGGEFRPSIYVAISVLIVTCPCALGLAVPIAHVVGAGRLFAHGVMIKDGAAFEKLTQTDTVIFDKTGTLTLGRPEVVRTPDISVRDVEYGFSLAQASHHPNARAVARVLSANPAASDVADFSHIRELAGMGMEGVVRGERMRLGRKDWVAEVAKGAETMVATTASVLWFAREGKPAVYFELEDILRPDAASVVARLEQSGFNTEILSGDRASVVQKTAQDLGVSRFSSDQTPAEKHLRIEALRRDGHKVLMVGDGINDAPALAAAHVSIAPSSGSDIGRQAADLVFTHDSLSAVPFAIDISRRVGSIVRQNFGLAIGYNCIAVPLAMFGYVTPLVAAIAMSGSSLLVVANSLRVHLVPEQRQTRDVQHLTGKRVDVSNPDQHHSIQMRQAA